MGGKVSRFLGVPLLALLFVVALAFGAWAATTAQVVLDKSEYTPGDYMVIMVKDSAANTNNATAESVTVTVSASSGDSISYVLKESGDNTGVFFSANATNNELSFNSTWYIDCTSVNCTSSYNSTAANGVIGVYLDTSQACTSHEGDASSSNGTLCVQPGDTITVTYGSVTATAKVDYHSGELSFRPQTVLPGDNETLALILKDADLNKNPTEVECVNGTDDPNYLKIYGKDQTGDEKGTIYPTLCETGKNTGVFAATGNVGSRVSDANGTSWRLNTSALLPGSTIVAEYVDRYAAGGVENKKLSATANYGISGETGELSVDPTAVDVADKATVTLTDANMNANSAKADTLDGTVNAGYLISDNGSDWFKVITWDGSPVKNKQLLVTNGTSVFAVVTDDNGNATNSTFVSYFGDAPDTCNASCTIISDGQPGFVEASPDGEHWVTLKLTETGVNTGTFEGKLSFSWKAVEVSTVDNGTHVTKLSANGTELSVNGTPGKCVVRVFTCDRVFEEFATVYFANGTEIVVEKLDAENAFIDAIGDEKVYVQKIGCDGDNSLGAFYGASYQLRYNDQYNDANEAEVITAGPVTINTYTAEISISPAEQVGFNQQVVVTLTDPDLNTNSTQIDELDNSQNATLPDAGCEEFVPDKRRVIVSTASTFEAVKVGTNACVLTMKETGVDTGVFSNKNDKLTLVSNSTDCNNNKLKVADGDVLYVYYYDSPSAEAAVPVGQVWTMVQGPTVGKSIGTIETNVDEAYALSNYCKQNDCKDGQTIEVTVTDADANVNPNRKDEVDVEVISSSDSSGITVKLKETGLDTGVFKGTFTITSEDTADKIKAIAGDKVRITYEDESTSPATKVTKDIEVKNFDATVTLDKESYTLGSQVKVTVSDPEANRYYNAKDTLTVTVKTDSDPVGVTMTLVETGKDTGVFEKTFTLTEDNSITNVRVKAAVGDTLTVRYVEPVDANGEQAIRTVTATVGEAAPQPVNAAPETALEAKTLADWPFDPAAVVTISGDQKKLVKLVVTMTVPEERRGQTAHLYYLITWADGNTGVVDMGPTTLGDTATFSIIPNAVDLSALSGTFNIYVGIASSADLSDLVFNYYQVVLE